MAPRQSVGLVRAWTFRLLLLLTSLTCFLSTAVSTQDRLQLSMDGVPATIELVSKTQTMPLPSEWSLYEERMRALFVVKVTPNAGTQTSQSLFLSKEVVEALLRGEKQEIVFVRDNPRRFLLKGEPLPSFGFVWSVLGLAIFLVFLYSLKLR